MDNATIYQAVGICGFVAYVVGFAGLQLGWLDGNGRLYCLSNFVGAVLVLISLYHAFNLASAMIQVAWIILSVIGLLRMRRCVASSHQLS